jgi:hypothetical protein
MSRSQKIEKPRRDKKYQTIKFILSSAIFARSAVRKGEGALKKKSPPVSGIFANSSGPASKPWRFSHCRQGGGRSQENISFWRGYLSWSPLRGLDVVDKHGLDV